MAGRYVTDRMFRTTLVDVADLRGAAPTWAYRFSWPSGTFGFAEHCLDVPFFFDCLDGPAIQPLAGPHPPQDLAEELHADAVDFIVGAAVGWPQWRDRRTARVYDEPVREVPDAYVSVAALRG